MKEAELGALARRIVRSADRASLGTTERNSEGRPYVSLVALATAPAGAPILLLSALSEHTRNLAEDDRASLLIVGPNAEQDPLAGPRVTLMGRLRRSDEPADRARYLRRHPAASLYASFADFGLQRFDLERVHLVAGFGTAKWLDRALLIAAPLFEEDVEEHAVLDRLGREQRPLLERIAGSLPDGEPGEWQPTGLDREGLDLRAGARTTRLAFEPPLGGADDLQAALERLAARA